MDMSLFWLFVFLNIVNVIIQTIKSLATIKCGKTVAAIANAIAFGFYTVVIVYMICDLPLWLKVLVVGLCNLVGVFIVKWGEEIARKEKLWKVEMTVANNRTKKLHEDLDSFNIPHNYIPNVGKWTIFNVYCATQKESVFVHEVANRNNARYFVSESKTL